MAKFRSYFASDLDNLKLSITTLLAFNSESKVDLSSFDSFCNRLDSLYTLIHNRDFTDLFCQK